MTWVVAYGSLMNKNEFSSRNHKLVIVKGWSRIFNKVASRSVWRSHAVGNKTATLNAIKSDFYLNAVAYEVTDDELESLKEREEDYHLEEVETFDFSTGDVFEKAFMFVSNEERDLMKIIRDDIFPIPKYFEVCLEGAYSWGDEFGKIFEETTFLANRDLI